MESNPLNLYYWKVIYDNGETLQEIEDGKTHSFKEVDLDKLVRLGWVSDNPNLPSYFVNLESFQRPILYRRRGIHALKKNAKPFTIGYLLGWQSTINGRNYKSIMFIRPDGEITLASRDIQF